MGNFRIYILDIAGPVVADERNRVVATNYAHTASLGDHQLVVASVVQKRKGLFTKRLEYRAFLHPDPLSVGDLSRFMHRQEFVSYDDLSSGVIIPTDRYNEVLDCFTVSRSVLAHDLDAFHRSRGNYGDAVHTLKSIMEMKLRTITEEYTQKIRDVPEPTLVDILRDKGLIDVAKYEHQATNL